MTQTTEATQPAAESDEESVRLSLSTVAARQLATTTKSVPQMQAITSRWLLKLLPWVQASGGTYRVNRRLSYTVGDGRVTFDMAGGQVRIIPAELRELPLLRDFEDETVLAALAERFEQREYAPGEVLAERGGQADQVFLIAHGKVSKVGAGKYGEDTDLGTLADGDYFGEQVLAGAGGTWEYTVRAATACTAMALPWRAFDRMNGGSEPLREHIRQVLAGAGRPQDEHGEAEIAVAAGHDGEPVLPGTYVDYEVRPREYELSVAQTVLRVHTRVADLYNQPMDQLEQQLRLTVEALRERQENEMINNPQFGLLSNADLRQRISTRSGPPTPDDLDELLSVVWKEPTFFLAHPKAIAAFGRECSKRGLNPGTVEFAGNHVPAWRGVPIFPCNKIPVDDTRSTSIMLMRTGEASQGVIGLHQVGLPDEYQPGLSVRFMGINEQALMSYLVSAYYSVAILVPDAMGVLENVEIGRAE